MDAKSSDRRKNLRIGRRLVARFDRDGKTEIRAILNFSEVGLFLQAPNPLKVGTQIVLKVGSGRTLELRGAVVWTRPEPLLPDAGAPGGMGISLVAAPEEYLELARKAREHLKNAPRGLEERFEAYHCVRFEHRNWKYSEHTENLSRGGAYIATAAPFERGDVFSGTLEIPGLDDPIPFKGTVAFHLSAKDGRERGRSAGVGVQFLELDPRARARLDHYLNRLEIHRARRERRFVGRIPEKGSLTEFLLPEILLALQAEHFTGILLLRRNDALKKIYLSKGVPVGAESTLRTDRLGHFLIRQGKLSEADFRASIEELTQGDGLLGELLIRRGLIRPSALAEALVRHQEDIITAAFPWFEGEFVRTAEVPAREGMTPVPLNLYRLFFDGVRRWFDAPLIRAWMGLHERSILQKTGEPEPDSELPPPAVRLLRHLVDPRPLEDLATELRIPTPEILPLAFALVIAGWVAMRFDVVPAAGTGTTAPPKDDASRKKLTGEALLLLKKRITEDFERFRSLDFYELLRVRPGIGDIELKKAYLELTGRYGAHAPDEIEDIDLREKLGRILAWTRLAYETLSEPSLRQIYARRGAKKQAGAERARRLDAEKHLFAGLSALEKGEFRMASLEFGAARKIGEGDRWIGGYLGFALFKEDPKENLKRAIELLDDALWSEVSDPQLYFFRAEIAGYLSNWASAEKLYDRAVRLQPNFIKAAVAAEKAKEKRIGQERLVRNIK